MRTELWFSARAADAQDHQAISSENYCIEKDMSGKQNIAQINQWNEKREETQSGIQMSPDMNKSSSPPEETEFLTHNQEVISCGMRPL